MHIDNLELLLGAFTLGFRYVHHFVNMSGL